jgi:hypothetical protein
VNPGNRKFPHTDSAPHSVDISKVGPSRPSLAQQPPLSAPNFRNRILPYTPWYLQNQETFQEHTSTRNPTGKILQLAEKTVISAWNAESQRPWKAQAPDIPVTWTTAIHAGMTFNVRIHSDRQTKFLLMGIDLRKTSGDPSVAAIATNCG